MLGDLDAARDWSDARDIVRGAALALAAPEPGEYVLASGRPHTVRELVQAAFAAAGVEGPLEQWVRVDPAFVRPPEPVVPAGDTTRARAGARLGPGDPVRADDRGHGGRGSGGAVHRGA